MGLKWSILAILMGWAVATPAGTEAKSYGIWVNPVRGQERWVSPDIDYLKDQIQVGSNNQIKGNWLLGYSALVDDQIEKELKTRGGDEIGAWLEIDEQLAQKTGVFYDRQRTWYDPGVVFLSAYERDQRKRLIDEYYREFKKRWGKWPQAVGAWWIDSWSVNYIKNKYGLKTVMIVADQRGTDGYGVWGQWTGVPYWPTKYNMLVPAINEGDSLKALVIQWAQRDLRQGYRGAGVDWSNHSVQANDYKALGKGFEYFASVARPYVEAGQLTLGLEVGQEASGNLEELTRQIKWAKEQGVEFTTMSQVNQNYQEKNGGKNQPLEIGGWKLTTEYRENRSLGQRISYPMLTAFSDYFKADKSTFLDRNLENLKPASSQYRPWWMAVAIGGVVWATISRKWWLAGGILWSLNGWGLVFKSTETLGWKVFYGPTIEGLAGVQIGLVVLGIIIAIWQKKRIKEMVLTFGLIPIIESLRYTVVEGVKYFGLMVGGRWLGWPGREFSDLEIHSMLRFPFQKIWENPLPAIIGYPGVMIILGLILSWLIKKVDKKWKPIVWLVLGGLVLVNLLNIWQAPPRSVIQ